MVAGLFFPPQSRELETADAQPGNRVPPLLLRPAGKMIRAYYSCTFTVRYTPTRFTRPVVPILSVVPNFRLIVRSAWQHYRLLNIHELSMQPVPPKQIHHVRPRLASYTLVLLPLFVFVFAVAGNSQQTEPQRPPSTNMGVSTGAAHPAVKDSKSRPITAGGFVDGAPVVFTDVT